MNTPAPRRPFRVVVIGAGVTGLTLSHALTKAMIEHVVLERDSIGPFQGASIGIHPHGCRILDQLGCLQDVERLCVPMKQFVIRLPNGRVLTRSDFFDFIAKGYASCTALLICSGPSADAPSSNGYDFLNVERRGFLQTMFDCLPEKGVVKTQQRIIEIIECEEGVKVVLADGTIERGDIIVGCDGVNSIVRKAMLANAQRTVPGHIALTENRGEACTTNFNRY